MSELFIRAAGKRAAGMTQLGDRPRQRRSALEAGAATDASARSLSLVRATEIGGDGPQVGGYASVTESSYEMCDFFGPYTEVVARGSFEQTLSQSPLVEFTVNHGAGGGLAMAHTRNGTLLLTEDETGLSYLASVDPSRSDVADLIAALSRGDMTEASFRFRINSGTWSPDYTQFNITSVDLNRGDVSVVNFGANPAATSELRSDENAPLLDTNPPVNAPRMRIGHVDDTLIRTAKSPTFNPTATRFGCSNDSA